MKTIRVCREHNLGQQECQQLAEQITDKLIARIGGQKSIAGNVVHYRHASGSKGTLTSTHHGLDIEVQLGFLVRSLAGTIEKEIQQSCDNYLGSQPS